MGVLILRSSLVAGGGGDPDAGSLATSFTVTSTAGGSQPFTVGHAFVKGEVPTGNYVTSADASSIECDRRNYWDDGSLKYGVISGIATFTANVAKTINLTTTTTAPSGSDVAEGAAPTASVTFTGGVTGTYTLASVWGVDRSTWSKANGGRVRSILGKVMSEFHYYVPTTDAHVAVWFYVRVYSNGLREIETVVENGWLNQASPTEKSYSITVDINGATVYTGTSLAHLHHTRWSRIDWHGTDPGITPAHNAAYCKRTGLFPNLGNFGNPSSTALNALSQPTAPFAQGDYPTDMGGTGGGGRLMNKWEAMYLNSGDSRAFTSMIRHAQAAGRYGIHYRDETTGVPALYASYTTTGYGSNSSISSSGSGDITLPANGGTGPPNYAKSHALPFGVNPYLFTGRHSFRELAEFQAQTCFFGATSSETFEGQRIPKATAGAFTKRGLAWSIRGMAAAILCVPDSDSRAAQYKTQLGKTVGYLGDSFTNQNNLGAINDYETYDAGVTTFSNFMEDSLTMAVGYAYKTAHHTLGSDKTRADAFAVWRMKHIVGRMGGQASDQYCYRDAANYTLEYASTDVASAAPATFNAAVYADWGAVYSASIGTNACNSGTTLEGVSGSDPSLMSTDNYPYWGLLHTALAYAVDLGAAGAATAWNRLVSATNYDPSGFDDIPTWSAVPSGGGWIESAAMTVGTWYEIGGTSLDLSLASTNVANDVNPDPGGSAAYDGDSGFASIWQAWCGAAFATGLGEMGSLICWGGGHRDYYGNGVYRFDLSGRTWTQHKAPSTAGPFSAGASLTDGAYSDGTPSPPHTYSYVQYDSVTNSFICLKSITNIGAPDTGSASVPLPWLYNVATSTWRKGTTASGISAQSGGASCYDTTRNCLWMVEPSTGDIGKFQPSATDAAGTWTVTAVSGVYDIYLAMGHDPVLDRLVVLDFTDGTMWYFDATNVAAGRTSVTMSGTPSLVAQSSLEWSSVLGAFVVHMSGTGNVYKLTTAGVWTLLTANTNGKTFTVTNGILSRSRVVERFGRAYLLSSRDYNTKTQMMRLN